MKEMKKNETHENKTCLLFAYHHVAIIVMQ
jgi:hypothetical protein